MNKLIKQFLYIVLISIFCGLVRYFTLEEYELFKSKVNLSTILDYDDYSPGPKITSIDYAKELFDNGLGLFIDARDINDFNDGHILNSINFPYGDEISISLRDSLENEITESINGIRNKILVIYCSGEGCTLSEDLAYELSEIYYEEIIYYFEEGFPVWKDLGYPIKIAKSEQNINKSIEDKPFYNFIDYIIIASIFIIFLLYFTNYKSFIPTLSRLILGFIFIYFSWDKILDPSLFSKIIRNYDILPFNLESFVALILPYAEILIGIFLILGIFLDVSSIISIILLILFILMIGQAYLRGKSIDCGCLLSDLSESSSSEKRMYMLKRIVQDICFILYALIVKYRVLFKRDK